MNELYARLLEDALAGGSSAVVISIIGSYFLKKFLATEAGKIAKKTADAVRKGLAITEDGVIEEEELTA